MLMLLHAAAADHQVNNWKHRQMFAIFHAVARRPRYEFNGAFTQWHCTYTVLHCPCPDCYRSLSRWIIEHISLGHTYLNISRRICCNKIIRVILVGTLSLPVVVFRRSYIPTPSHSRRTVDWRGTQCATALQNTSSHSLTARVASLIHSQLSHTSVNYTAE